MTLTPFDDGYVPPPPAPPKPEPTPKAARTTARPGTVRSEPKAPREIPPVEPAPALVWTEADSEFLADFGLSGEPRERVEVFDKDRWGLYPDMTAEEYYADPCPDVSISNSGLGVLLGETAKDFAFQNPRINVGAAPELVKSNMVKRRGDVVHQLALEKGRGYAIGAKAWKTWQSGDAKRFKEAAEERGLTPILPHAFEEAKKIAAVVRERIKRACDGADYQTEVPFMFQHMTPYGPIWVRGMMDVWCEELCAILDPKITDRIYGDKPARHMVDMGWDRQGALYRHAIGTIFPEKAGRVQFADLMVKPKPPFTHRTVAPERAWEATSLWECYRGFELFGQCLYSGEWPGFPDSIERLPCPPYEAKRREVLHEGVPEDVRIPRN
jgi:hypothetical protein